jgi:uncharacterized repeat protein (TIGR01451 family)
MMRKFLPLLLVCAFASAALAQSADVSVSLTMDSTAVYSGGSGSAGAGGHVTITNAGSVPAQNVTVDFDPATTADFFQGFTCAFVTNHYRCTAASLAPGSVSVNIGATWRNAPPPGTVETTTVTVSSASPSDPDTTNNSASAMTTIIWSADLQLEGTGNLGTIGAGYYVAIPIEFVNHGPSPATDFKLTFNIPSGATFSRVDFDSGGPPFSCTSPPVGQAGDVVCTTPSFSTTAGDMNEYVTVQLVPSTPSGTILTFNETLTSSDALKSPQTATGSVQVVAAADVAVAMSSPSAAYIGTTYNNVVTVTNSGPGPSVNLSVIATFAGGITAGAPTAPPGWTCHASNQIASCGTSSFAPGTAQLAFPAFLPINAPLGPKTQSVKVVSANDLNSDNNTAATSTTIQPAPQTDLSVSIAGAPSVVHTGDVETYTIQVTNTGNAPALNVELNTHLPGTIVSSICPGGTTLCSYASLDAGATANASFAMRTDATAPGTLTASVVATAFNVTGQRTASTTTTCAGEPNVDLEATVTAPAAAKGGQNAVWTIGIVNHGPDPVYGWNLTLSIPADVSLSSPTSSDPSVRCTNSGTTAQCGGVLLSNNQMTFQVTGIVALSATQPLHATVTASTENNDLHPANNVVTADTPIAPPGPDLTVTLKPAAWAIAAGASDDITFEVSNVGRLPSAGSTLTVPLAPYFTLGAPAPAWCSGTTTLSCNYGYISPGTKAPTTLTLRPTGLGTFTATATVTTPATEERTDNNTSSVTITVVEPGERHRAARH